MKTKNYEPDSVIESMDELLGQESVFVQKYGKITPVAFIQNWQAWRVHSWIKSGVFWTKKPRLRDKNGEYINHKDMFVYEIRPGEVVAGVRVGDALRFADGITHSVKGFIEPGHNQQDFTKVNSDAT